MKAENLVFASYFNYVPDPHRGHVWTDNPPERLYKLINSVISKDVKIKVFHNCFLNVENTELIEWIKVEPNINYVPSVTRWFEYLKYLKSLDNLPDAVFMVDSLDVKMLKNPFAEYERDFIYCGDEEKTVADNYLSVREPYIRINDYRSVIDQNIDHKLLNAGVLGGSIVVCIEFLEKLTENHLATSDGLTDVSLDMPIYNYVALKHFKDKLKHGIIVNTPFKKNIYNDISWWKHK